LLELLEFPLIVLFALFLALFTSSKK